MSSTLEITGRMTMPNAPGGATTQKLIGAPTITPSSTTGAEVDYNEKCEYEFKILAGATQVVNFGSVADGAFLYIGTDKAITYKLNGGSEVFALAAEGFALIKGGSLTALSITAGILAANVYVLVVGD